MGFLDFFSGLRDVARVTISFQATGDHRITVERELGAPVWLDRPVLEAVLLLHYAAKAFHALGSAPAAEELRRHVALSALVLRNNRFEPFTSFIDQPGRCIGRLQTGRSGALSINTRFQVPLRETNNYVLDSVLMLFSHAVAAQPTADHRSRLADAVQALEQYYDAVAGSASLKALREAPVAAVERYCRGMSLV